MLNNNYVVELLVFKYYILINKIIQNMTYFYEGKFMGLLIFKYFQHVNKKLNKDGGK